MGFPFPSTCVSFQSEPYIPNVLNRSPASIRRFWFHEPTDSVIRCTASSYTSVGGGSHHRGSRHPSPKFCPIQPSQEAKRWEEDRRNRTFLSGKYLPVWAGGRWAKYPRSHTLPQLPKLGDPSRCCGQPRVTEIINHSPFFFYSPEKRTQPALPSYHLRIGACLSRNPRHAMRNEGSGD